MRQAIGCDAMPRLIADSRIMDHGIEATEGIGLGSDILCASDGLDISDYDRLGLRQGAPRVLRAFGTTGMENHPMALARKQFAGRSSSGVLVLVADGYGPLIELGVWGFSADSHFSTQSLA
jgi:hypothetical protein